MFLLYNKQFLLDLGTTTFDGSSEYVEQVRKKTVFLKNYLKFDTAVFVNERITQIKFTYSCRARRNLSYHRLYMYHGLDIE